MGQRSRRLSTYSPYQQHNLILQTTSRWANLRCVLSALHDNSRTHPQSSPSTIAETGRRWRLGFHEPGVCTRAVASGHDIAWHGSSEASPDRHRGRSAALETWDFEIGGDRDDEHGPTPLPIVHSSWEVGEVRRPWMPHVVGSHPQQPQTHQPATRPPPHEESSTHRRCRRSGDEHGARQRAPGLGFVKPQLPVTVLTQYTYLPSSALIHPITSRPQDTQKKKPLANPGDALIPASDMVVTYPLPSSPHPPQPASSPVTFHVF
ncbi:hypothetical protein B0T16DRAFT_399195 [Cercophora newfieldiana]|uniref:Uncharacterized protein n=1 Tax=Cercophora newfieldiana TaxID=92897 RepID=A0AA40D0T5_9PEZI|nr:hypothetical protein B0T16DRAFT_399195 [Cercophora newfieldiana]